MPFSTEEPCDHPSASTSTTAQGGSTHAIATVRLSGTTRDQRFPPIGTVCGARVGGDADGSVRVRNHHVLAPFRAICRGDHTHWRIHRHPIAGASRWAGDDVGRPLCPLLSRKDLPAKRPVSRLPWLTLTVHGTATHIGRLLRPITTEPETRGWNRFGKVSLWVSAGAVVIALLFTAGHTQETYYALLTIGAEAVIFTIAPPARRPVRGSHLLSFGVITALGMLLAAAQLVPTLELSQYGYRVGGMSLDEAGSYAIDRTHILESLLPTYWNLPAQEVTGYTGIVAIPLTFAALGAARARRQMFALGAIALGALILGVGVYTPVFDALHRFVPMFASFRAPGRWLLIWTFAVAGLASHGLDALGARRSSKTTRQLLAHSTDQSAQIASVTAIACAMIGLVVARTFLVGGVQWLPPGRVALTWFWFGGTTIALVSFLGQARGTIHALVRCAIVGLICGELLLAGHRMEYALGGEPRLYTKPPPVTAHAMQTLATRAPAASPG